MISKVQIKVTSLLTIVFFVLIIGFVVGWKLAAFL